MKRGQDGKSNTEREKESRHKGWVVAHASYFASFATHGKPVNRKSKYEATKQHRHPIAYGAYQEHTTTTFMLINDDIERRKWNNFAHTSLSSVDSVRFLCRLTLILYSALPHST